MVFPDSINIRVFKSQNEYLERSNMASLGNMKLEVYEEMNTQETKQNLRIRRTIRRDHP